MDMLAGASEQRAFRASAAEVANELASRLNCRRVSVGIAKDGSIDLVAISHSAVFPRKNSRRRDDRKCDGGGARPVGYGGVSGRYRTGAPHYTGT